MSSSNYDDLMGDIDSLIAENLEQGERDEAFQSNPDPCPHCNQMWHGLAVTRRMVEMREEYQARQIDLVDRYYAGEDVAGDVDYADWHMPEDYVYAEDDSHIFCPGSDIYGPNPPDSIWDQRHRVEYYGNRGHHRRRTLRTFRLERPNMDLWDIEFRTEAEFANEHYLHERPLVLNTRNTATMTLLGRHREQDLVQMGIGRLWLENDWTCHWEGTNGTWWSAPKVKFQYSEVMYEMEPGQVNPPWVDIVTGYDLLHRHPWLRPFFTPRETSPCHYHASAYEQLWTNKGLGETGKVIIK